MTIIIKFLPSPTERKNALPSPANAPLAPRVPRRPRGHPPPRPSSKPRAGGAPTARQINNLASCPVKRRAVDGMLTAWSRNSLGTVRPWPPRGRPIRPHRPPADARARQRQSERAPLDGRQGRILPYTVLYSGSDKPSEAIAVPLLNHSKPEGVLSVLSTQAVKPHRPLTDREWAILVRAGAENDPLIIEALNLFNATVALVVRNPTKSFIT